MTHNLFSFLGLRAEHHLPAAAGSCRVLSPRHTARRAVSRAGNAFAAVIMLLFACGATPVHGQGADGDVLVRQAVDAFHHADRWLRTGDVPARIDPAAPVEDVLGVAVTLRWQGYVIGRGQAEVDETPGADVPAVIELTRLAVGRANEDFTANLVARVRTDEAAAGLDDRMAHMRATMTIDLQLAHGARVIDIADDAPADEVYRHFAPGFHGLRLTLHQADVAPVHADVWPGTVIASNINPRSQLMQLLSQLHFDRKVLPQLGRAALTDVTLRRFEVIQLVQPAPHLPVTQLVRGNVVIPRGAVNERMLDAMAQRMVDNLLVRVREDGLLAGTFLPTPNRYDPALADPADAALAVYALAQWHNAHRAAGARGPAVRDALALSTAELIKRLEAGDEPAQPATLALLILTFADSPFLHEHEKRMWALAEQLMTLRRDDGTFRGQDDEAASLTTQAVVAAAMMRLDAKAQLRRYRLIARELIDYAWRESDVTNIVGALPWLHDAERALFAADAKPGEPFRPMYPVELDNALNLLLAVQVVDEPRLGPADVLGGFDFSAADRFAPPNPDWRSAYALHALSGALGDPHLASADRARLTDRCALAARFVAQLMFDESNSYYVRSTDDAFGAVRSRLWDNPLGVTPTAASLLAVVRLQEAL